MTNPRGAASPLFTRLARAGRFEDIRLLAAYVRARRNVANDNVLPAAGEQGADSIMVVRPTVEEIARAGEEGLRFDKRGRLVAWRLTDASGKPILDKRGNERWLRPIDCYKQPRGARRKTVADRQAEDAAYAERLMSLRGITPFPDPWVVDARYASYGGFFGRLRTAYDELVRAGIPSSLREFLAVYSVDGTRTLEQAAAANPQARVMRGRTVIAHGADFLAGKTDKSGTSSPGSYVGAPDAAENAMIAAFDAEAAGAIAGDVLDMALAGHTAREIAVSNGRKSNKGGEEWAVREMDRAIDRLKNIAA